MKRALAIFGILLVSDVGRSADTPFIVEPYLQLGSAPSPDSMTLMWHAADTDAAWGVQVKIASGGKWSESRKPIFRRVAVSGIEPHRVYRATLTGLKPGAEFDYRVRLGDRTVFESRGQARKTRDQAYRVAIFGDCGAGTAEQRGIAYQVYRQKPDLVFIPGDIVYNRGLISEYRAKFFPAYNASTASPETGAPLIRSTLFTAAPGNHDTLRANLTVNPDALAYFLYWDQPLNGPITREDDSSSPAFLGNEERKKMFLQTTGEAYPRMANFSFDYGNAHWLVLDSNPYVKWESPALREWVRKDLAAAKSATWRFVGFHHPGFNSAKSHFEDQWMRRLSDVFEAGGVDIVFAGHVHNYQRSYPMRFKFEDVNVGAKGTTVDGDWTLDREFDGVNRTKPNGIIYLVTGAGGARLYNPEQADPSTWQQFTTKYAANVNSFTLMDTDGAKLTLRQIAIDGRELDRFVVTK